MATQTQTLKRVQQARLHDYLYDATHTVASVRDHAREAFIARTNVDQLQALPVYNHMFSDLRQYPRFEYRMQSNDNVPPHINRQWQGQNEAHQEQIALSKLFTGNDAFVVQPRTFAHVDVGGRERAKFFRKPLLPFVENIQPLVVLDTTRSTTFDAGDKHHGMPGTRVSTSYQSRKPRPTMETQATRTQGIQTDYMEREAQTDPYTPEYVCKPGEQPEVLTLATLMHNKGLPAGLAEVEMIERARAKRAWEASLPSLSDGDQWDKRFKMMSEMERHEWLLRENEIEKLQNIRIELLESLLRDNESRRYDTSINRINKQWSQKQIEREDYVKKNRLHYLRAIRSLLLKRQHVETKYEKTDVIRDYTRYESESYAPLTRHGYFPDKLTDKYIVKNRYLDTYQGLLELESTLPSSALKIKLHAPKRISTTKAGFLKRNYRRERDLENIYNDIISEKMKEPEEPKPLRFLVKVEKPLPRPPTPGVDVPDLDNEEREVGLIYLQKIIRGRAIQNMMYRGKEERIELIKEMRSTHALQETDMREKKLRKQDVQVQQHERRKDVKREEFIDSVLQTYEGEAISDVVDFLSKELIRLQEERRIEAFAILAERNRRLREAEESGLRQVLERRRREEDEIFKQLLKMTQNTVDTYLEDIILDSMNECASEQARIEIQEKAVKINEIANEIEQRRTQFESEGIVAELVHGFLIPEIAKQESRAKVRQAQQKYLMAAHDLIEGCCSQLPENEELAKQTDEFNDNENNDNIEHYVTDREPFEEQEPEVNEEELYDQGREKQEDYAEHKSDERDEENEEARHTGEENDNDEY